MPKYDYSARDSSGKLTKGTLIADDELDLSDRLSKMGCFLVGFKINSGNIAVKSKMPKLKSKVALDFTFQCSTLLDAGLPLLDGIRNLSEETVDVNAKRVLADIVNRIESGSTFKDALSNHPGSFSALYISVVGAGEATGKLGQSMDDMAKFLEWQYELKSRVKEAGTYPIILTVVMIGVVSLLVGKVIPMFAPIFEKMDVELPLPTRVVLALSDIVVGYWYVILIVVFGLIFGLKYYNKTSSGHFVLDSLKLKLPLLGDLLRKLALSRFAHTFVLCFKAGISLLACLDISKDATDNLRIGKAVGTARNAVNVGEKLATALKNTGEFPSMVIRMVEVGEQSGQLIQTLGKVSEFYDKEVASTIKKIFAMFEPIMIVVMGVVVGGIAMAIFLPMFSLMNAVG